MKTWAEKRQRQMEAMGATELAEMFKTIVKLCELEEQIDALQDLDEFHEVGGRIIENSNAASVLY